MPTRRIDDDEDKSWKAEPCYDRDHDPPSHMVWPPGTYEHVCPSCGKTVRFTVARISCLSGSSSLTLPGR